MDERGGRILLTVIFVLIVFAVVMGFVLVYQHFSIRRQTRKREAEQNAGPAQQDVERDAGMELGVVKVDQSESYVGSAVTPVVDGEGSVRDSLDMVPVEDAARRSVDVATRVAALREGVFAVTDKDDEPLPDLAAVYEVGDDSDDESDDESDTAKRAVDDDHTPRASDDRSGSGSDHHDGDNSSDGSTYSSQKDDSPAVSPVDSQFQTTGNSPVVSPVAPLGGSHPAANGTSIYESPRYDSADDTSDGEWDSEKKKG